MSKPPVMSSRMAALAMGCVAALVALAGCCRKLKPPQSGPYELHLDFVRLDGTVVKSTILPAQAPGFAGVAADREGKCIVVSAIYDTYFLDGAGWPQAYHSAKEAKEILLRPSFSPKGEQVAFFSVRQAAAREGERATSVAFFTPGGRRICRVPVPAEVLPLWPMEMLQPRMVAAEFAGLPARSVAVVVDAGARIRAAYPGTVQELAPLIGTELRARITDVSVIQPREIIQDQRQHPEWRNQPLTRMGKRLGADYVLYVELLEYSHLEPGSLVLLRGRLHGRASLWDVSGAKGKARVWQRDSIRVTYPPGMPALRDEQDQASVLRELNRLFAETLVRSFYRHTVPAEICEDQKAPPSPSKSRRRSGP